MDSSSTPPGGTPEQPNPGMPPGSSDPNTPSSPWTPPAYPPSGGAPPTPPEGYRVEQPLSGQQYVPPPGYQPPPQGAPTQPYGQPGQGYPQPQGYPQQGQGYPQPQGYQQPPAGQQPVYGPPVGQGYAPPGYQQPYAQTQVAAKKSGVPVFVWVLGGILLFIIACGAIAYFTVFAAFNSAGSAIKGGLNTIAAEASATAFDLALETGSYEDAYSYLGGDLAKNYSAAKLQQKWEALAGSDNVFSINSRFGAPKDAGNNRTTIDWIITPPNGSSKTVVLTMDEGTKDWKIIDAKPDLIPNP